MKRTDLPPPVCQHKVRDHGSLIAVLDFAYPELRLAVETDGYRWHSGRARWEHDLARHNRLTLLGWRILHVTSADLSARPAEVVEEVKKAHWQAEQVARP